MDKVFVLEQVRGHGSSSCAVTDDLEEAKEWKEICEDDAPDEYVFKIYEFPVGHPPEIVKEVQDG